MEYIDIGNVSAERYYYVPTIINVIPFRARDKIYHVNNSVST